MQQLKPIGRIFYGLGIAGIGILHFIYPGFRPVVLPIPAEETVHLEVFVYIVGALLTIAGLFIASGRGTRTAALLLGIFLLLLFLLGHLPNRLINDPANVGAWTDALKLLALCGGAFIVTKLFPGHDDEKLSDAPRKIAFMGKYFFAIMLIVFGIDHFLYADFVKTLVPEWIGANLVWTYIGGGALIGLGLSIILNIKMNLAGLLGGVMLLLWLVLLHIPRAISMASMTDGNEIVSVFECLAFSGMSFLLYFYER